ncbi:acetyl-CoA synthetase-like protein [Cubamyces sp. BRFM 1775]|nr:acetyl-CoA synthetase-like protein [Cubamyces sp. BRFM 1775]
MLPARPPSSPNKSSAYTQYTDQLNVPNGPTNAPSTMSTFTFPPLDDVLSVPQLYEFHAKNSPDHPVYMYVDPVTGALCDITYAEVWARIGVAMKLISRRQSTLPDRGISGRAGSRTVIGIVALSDALSYIYTMLAIVSLGDAVFPMSLGNSAQAIAHLAETTGIRQIFVSEDEGTQALVHDAAGLLREKGIEVDLVPMIKYADTEPTSDQGEEARIVDIADDEVMMYLHSSGTTGMSKAVPITRKGSRQASNLTRLGEVDFLGKRIGMHTNPPCHGLGTRAINAPISTGAIVAVYPPIWPPTVPTPANFLQAWTACKCDIILCIPPFLEALAKNPANLLALKGLEYVIYSGVSMKKATGDMLSASGVRLCSFYGCTEGGSSGEWEYFELHPHVACTMVPMKGRGGGFDAVMTVSETVAPNAFNTELDGKPALSFEDVLEPHPTDPRRWKVLGRRSNQIVLSAGANVNPAPIEETLVQDPRIKSAIVFGHQQLEIGVLVEAAPSHDIPPGDMEAIEKFKQSIWPTFEKINETAASYAKIRREMILVTSPDKPLQYTAKRTPRRDICLVLYSKEIEDLYASAEADESPEKREFRLRM